MSHLPSLLTKHCGYSPHLVRKDYRFSCGVSLRSAPVVAFAQEPLDARSACIVAIGQHDEVPDYRELGAPIVLREGSGGIEWWVQHPDRCEKREFVPERHLVRFLNAHRADFSPQAVYRAKTMGRLGEHQLEFVDLGLMPLVEGQIGQKLTGLVVRVVQRLRHDLSWDKPTSEQGQWLFRAAFWLLAAKILHDKGVESFVRLDLRDPDDVFARVERHYGQDSGKPPIPSERRQALQEAAKSVADYAPLTHVTTEALADVYESALITKETRQALGTHSTPSFLVDYMVGRLRPWIEEIPWKDRFVFEPACGHAGFLVAAMRLLRELLPLDMDEKQRRQYLRGQMAGIEVDAFAFEIARLCLTLADIPYPDGWRLENGDMFVGDALEQGARRARILLANPPFENFTQEEREHLETLRSPPQLVNKTAEMLRRVLPCLRPGAAVGVVVPQGFLRSGGAKPVRELLLREFELGEIALFPDKVFKFYDMETAVLLARRRPTHSPPARPIRYVRLGERDLDRFRRTYQGPEELVPQSDFQHDPQFRLVRPALAEVWTYLANRPPMGSVATVGQGFSFRSGGLSGVHRSSDKPFSGGVPGYGKLGRGLTLHGAPTELWFDLDPRLLMAPRAGIETGRPQVLLNRAPADRGPWRIKAFLDHAGHAFTSRFTVLRPFDARAMPIQYLWALANSPLANAYAYSHGTKRDIVAGLIAQMPLPSVSTTDVRRVASLAKAYLEYVTPRTEGLTAPVDAARAKALMLRMDAEVMRLYDLPPRLERRVLDLFDGYPRVGVPFRQERYYPEGFDAFVPLHEFLSDGFQNSTAGQVAARMQTAKPSRAVLEALRIGAGLAKD